MKAACDQLREALFDVARSLQGSPFGAYGLDDVAFAEGRICLRRDQAVSIAFDDILRHCPERSVHALAQAAPDEARRKRACYSHSAVFAEVLVDEDFGTVRMGRVVSAVAGGRILNPKTARSQLIGGIVWGISSALHEETKVDHQLGRVMNHNLAEYHIPVNSDIPEIDVIFVDEHDDFVNPLGVKGLGELGVVGVAAAIANAVFHATGKRVRDLPITPDRLLEFDSVSHSAEEVRFGK